MDISSIFVSMWSAKKLYWLLQLLGWMAFCMLIGFTNYTQGKFDKYTLFQLGELFFLLVTVTHINRVIMLKFDWLNMKLAPLIPRLIALNFTSSLVLLFLSYITNRLFYDSKDIIQLNASEFFVNSVVYTLFFLLWSAIYLSYHLINKSRHQEIRNLQLEASNNEIELKTLRDQLNPHFLFNSLNVLILEIKHNPTTAIEFTRKLSKVYRYVLQSKNHDLIALNKELEFIDSFVYLHKVRIGDALEYSVNISDEVLQMLLPPLTLQILIENAVKHNVANEENVLKISIKSDDDNKLIVSNNMQAIENVDSMHTGLSNLSKRFELLKKNGFAYGEQEEKFVVNIPLIDE